MKIDPIDRKNMIRMVLGGRLEDLRTYAKALIRVDAARTRVDASGRGGIAFYLPSFHVTPDPEIVVLEQEAIDKGRTLLEFLRTHDTLSASGQGCLDWFAENLPPVKPEPEGVAAAVCAPSAPNYLLHPGAGEAT